MLGIGIGLALGLEEVQTVAVSDLGSGYKKANVYPVWVRDFCPDGNLHAARSTFRILSVAAGAFYLWQIQRDHTGSGSLKLSTLSSQRVF